MHRPCKVVFFISKQTSYFVVQHFENTEVAQHSSIAVVAAPMMLVTHDQL